MHFAGGAELQDARRNLPPLSCSTRFRQDFAAKNVGYAVPPGAIAPEFRLAAFVSRHKVMQ
jgi:hypothetical protein